MITISRKAKVVATILHLAIVGFIIALNISEKTNLMKIRNVLTTEISNDIEFDTHLKLLQRHEAKLVLVIITAIIAQSLIITIEEVGLRIGSNSVR